MLHTPFYFSAPPPWCVLLNSRWYFLTLLRTTSSSFQAFHQHWTQHSWKGHCSVRYTLLDPDSYFWAWRCIPLHWLMLLDHSMYPPHLSCNPHHTLLFWQWYISFSPKFFILPFTLHFHSLLANISVQPSWHFTSWAYKRMNSIVHTGNVWIINQYSQDLHRPYANDALCIASFVSSEVTCG